ncbi:hypothetical protein [Spirosoma aerolatum]|uniref:hypothetical protein n=1 Tax=Spirosoma aerolatum TaxID=1211326 RepID=UPI0009AC632C|nr:hypothetical protein [Spirosoma aerolatum]
MKYQASTHLKLADTTGRVPASILDGFIREELLRQISTALKSHLPIHRSPFTNPSQVTNQTDQVNFTTELVILSCDQWYRFRLEIDHYCLDLPTDKRHELQALLDAMESPENTR